MDEKKEYTCSCSDSCSTDLLEKSSHNWKIYIPASISLVMLVSGIVMDNFLNEYFNSYYRLIWYIVAYIPVAYSVFKEAIETIKQKVFFSEFTLMIVATLGAFLIAEYPEGVAVMLFYSIGEFFQNSAVNKAKRNIKILLDERPDKASVKRNGIYMDVSPEEVRIGETIQVKAGEKVSLDGVLVSEISSFNTSALTGES